MPRQAKLEPCRQSGYSRRAAMSKIQMQFSSGFTFRIGMVAVRRRVGDPRHVAPAHGIAVGVDAFLMGLADGHGAALLLSLVRHTISDRREREYRVARRKPAVGARMVNGES